MEIEKQVLLRSLDTLWVEHLVAIDYLRTGIGLRGYGQRDPLTEYKRETYHMFNNLLNLIQKEVVYAIYKASIGLEAAASTSMFQSQSHGPKLIFSGADTGEGNAANGNIIRINNQIVKDKTPGRNEPCPCGSGKKYKKCHGK